MVERLFLTVPLGCLQFVIVVFPDHTHLLYITPISPLKFRLPKRCRQDLQELQNTSSVGDKLLGPERPYIEGRKDRSSLLLYQIHCSDMHVQIEGD